MNVQKGRHASAARPSARATAVAVVVAFFEDSAGSVVDEAGSAGISAMVFVRRIVRVEKVARKVLIDGEENGKDIQWPTWLLFI